jgi:hypothetical protein
MIAASSSSLRSIAFLNVLAFFGVELRWLSITAIEDRAGSGDFCCRRSLLHHLNERLDCRHRVSAGELNDAVLRLRPTTWVASLGNARLWTGISGPMIRLYQILAKLTFIRIDPRSRPRDCGVPSRCHEIVAAWRRRWLNKRILRKETLTELVRLGPASAQPFTQIPMDNSYCQSTVYPPKS